MYNPCWAYAEWILSHTELKRNEFLRMLSIRGTDFIACWACAKIIKSWISRPNQVRFSKISCYRPLGPYGFGFCKKNKNKNFRLVYLSVHSNLKLIRGHISVGPFRVTWSRSSWEYSWHCVVLDLHRWRFLRGMVLLSFWNLVFFIISCFQNSRTKVTNLYSGSLNILKISYSF